MYNIYKYVNILFQFSNLVKTTVRLLDGYVLYI